MYRPKPKESSNSYPNDWPTNSFLYNAEQTKPSNERERERNVTTGRSPRSRGRSIDRLKLRIAEVFFTLSIVWMCASKRRPSVVLVCVCAPHAATDDLLRPRGELYVCVCECVRSTNWVRFRIQRSSIEVARTRRRMAPWRDLERRPCALALVECLLADDKRIYALRLIEFSVAATRTEYVNLCASISGSTLFYRFRFFMTSRRIHF